MGATYTLPPLLICLGESLEELLSRLRFWDLTNVRDNPSSSLN
jgi:hypothetical protein